MGKLTCWTRLVDDKSVRKSGASESDGLSTCMLKSPVIKNS